MTGRKAGQRREYAYMMLGVLVFAPFLAMVVPPEQADRYWTAVQAAIAVFATAIAADTVRPSGSDKAAIMGTRPAAPAVVVTGPAAKVDVPPAGG